MGGQAVLVVSGSQFRREVREDDKQYHAGVLRNSDWIHCHDNVFGGNGWLMGVADDGRDSEQSWWYQARSLGKRFAKMINNTTMASWGTVII